MALFHRLSGFNDDGTDHTDDPTISSHQFAAGIREVIRGNVTRAQLETTWGLDPTDLDAIVAKFQSITNADADVQTLLRQLFVSAVEDWAMLAEQQIGITTQAIWDARVSGY